MLPICMVLDNYLVCPSLGRSPLLFPAFFNESSSLFKVEAVWIFSPFTLACSLMPRLFSSHLGSHVDEYDVASGITKRQSLKPTP